jgi:aspartyl-tRNA(Asn)/glutamyl-tRNA(Gln) amidotransferase subunit A
VIVSEMLDRTVSHLARQVREGDVTARALVDAAIARIEDGRALGAFVHVDQEDARAQADAVDARRQAGEALGPLAGLPIAVKDALCTAGQPTTAGSAILCESLTDGRAKGPYRPPYDATVVARLRDADAVILGKTNMDELAMGSSGENSAYGPSKNPWDTSRAPGGSSSGSAVAVAAGMAPASLGSDTGGSVRQPAAFTGTVGLKPSYGRVSRYGLIAFASSLDQVGPITRDVRSAATVLGVIAGHDPRDATCLDRPTDGYAAACDVDVKGLRVGIPEEYFAEGLAPEVEQAVRAAVERLRSDGATIEEVSLPHTRHAVATYYVIATAECSSNLARFDGVRFGHRAPGVGDIRELYRRSRSEGFGTEVKRRIMLGTYVLSAGYYEAYYGRAQRVRTLIARDFEAAFENVDVIATPTSPTVAFPLGSRLDDPLSMYLSDVYTLPASLAGVCALSLPCGLGTDSGMPIGLQLIGPSLGEATLFRAAAAVEARAPELPSPPAAPQRPA